jgi:hypothetical protein
MKRFVAGFSLAVALMASVCTGPATAGPAQHGRSVGRVLSDVTITGKVASKAEVQRAVALARKVDGVKAVKSFLQIVPQEKTAGYRSQTKAKTG